MRVSRLLIPVMAAIISSSNAVADMVIYDDPVAWEAAEPAAERMFIDDVDIPRNDPIAPITTFLVSGDYLDIDDVDDDGLVGANDNCAARHNPAQRDSDGDGLGNACDADLDNDGLTTLADFALFRTVMFSTDPHADFDGDGIVTLLDLAILKEFLFAPPGPPGLVSWNAPGGGQWQVRENWSPQVIPAWPAVVVVETLPGTSARIGPGVVATAAQVRVNGTLALAGGELRETVVAGGQQGLVHVHTANARLNAVTLDVPMLIDNGASALVSRNLVVNDRIELRSSDASTGLLFDGGEQTLSGGGDIFINAAQNPVVTDAHIGPINGGTLHVLEDGPPIHGGSGTVGTDGLTTVLGVRVTADVPGASIEFRGKWAVLGQVSSIWSVDGGKIGIRGTMGVPEYGLCCEFAGDHIELLDYPTINGDFQHYRQERATVTVQPPGAYFATRVDLNVDFVLNDGALIAANGNITIGEINNTDVLAEHSPTGFIFVGEEARIFEGGDPPSVHLRFPIQGVDPVNAIVRSISAPLMIAAKVSLDVYALTLGDPLVPLEVFGLSVLAGGRATADGSTILLESSVREDAHLTIRNDWTGNTFIRAGGVLEAFGDYHATRTVGIYVASPTQHGDLATIGAADFSQAKLRVLLVDGYQPASGDSLRPIRYDTLVAPFEDVSQAAPFLVSYGPNSIELTVP